MTFDSKGLEEAHLKASEPQRLNLGRVDRHSQSKLVLSAKLGTINKDQDTKYDREGIVAMLKGTLHHNSQEI